MSGVSPVGRFSPAPGIFLDQTEKAVEITGDMELFGPEATAGRAASVAYSINSVWTASFPDGYQVKCKVNVTYRAPGTAAGDVAQIEGIKIAGPSHVAGVDRAMTLNANEPNAFTWTAAHEFGHVIGLQDRYSEGIMSRLRGRFGGTRATTVDPLYQANLMAVQNGVLESKNLRDLSIETQPSAYWFNDDDRVRDWVNHHVISDVSRLSADDKIRMIKILMSGWVSSDDVVTIVRICGAVSTHGEGERVRGGVNVIDLSDFGQRARVRAALGAMP